MTIKISIRNFSSTSWKAFQLSSPQIRVLLFFHLWLQIDSGIIRPISKSRCSCSWMQQTQKWSSARNKSNRPVCIQLCIPVVFIDKIVVSFCNGDHKMPTDGNSDVPLYQAVHKPKRKICSPLSTQSMRLAITHCESPHQSSAQVQNWMCLLKRIGLVTAFWSRKPPNGSILKEI